MIPFAPEGRIFIIGTAWMSVLTLVFGYTLAGVVLLLVAIALLLLFRKMRNRITPEEEGFLSPADGTIESITMVDDPVSGALAHCICIRQRWLGEGSLHVPAEGRLEKRHEGTTAQVEGERTLPDDCMMLFFSSLKNDRFTLSIDRKGGPRFLRLDAATGSQYQRGQRLGFVGFHNRICLYLPVSEALLVHEGDRIDAGVTRLARPALSSAAC